MEVLTKKEEGDLKTSAVVLRLEGVSKRFGGIRALHQVELSLIAGKVMALIGENGAGKSTLVKILTGIYQADEGTIFIDGKPVVLANPRESQIAKIAAIHQEITMFDEITVAENIYMGHFPGSRFFLQRKKLFARSRELLQSIGVDLNPEIKLGQLSVAEKHLIEIARALSYQARVVIMDEPSAALSKQEILRLYKIIERLRDEGKAILFISHKFDEIFDICDFYTVFRDGEYIDSGNISQINTNELISLMVGRKFEQGIYPERSLEHEVGEKVLEIKDFGNEVEFSNISFSVRSGEIVGFYSLIGSGRSELMQSIFGVNKLTHGSIFMDGQELKIRSSRDAVQAGMAYLPEDRQRQGLFLQMSIRDNVTIVHLHTLLHGLRLQRKKESAAADKLCQHMRVKYSSNTQEAQELSGGNQQKVVIAKWLATKPRVLIIDEPTKGIDVSSKAYVHETLIALAKEGMAIIMVSSELPEILGVSDRIFIMREGMIAAEISGQEADAETLLKIALKQT